MSIIAPGITDQDYKAGVAKPIDIFERRINQWILKFAGNLVEQADSGIAVLLLTSSVLEPMGGALLGASGNTEERFGAGLRRAFPKLQIKTSNCVCDLLRDGLFHKSFIKAGLVLQPLDEPIKVDSGAIFIDPVRFLKAVEGAFSALCNDIRSKREIAKTFDAYWEKTAANEEKYQRANFPVPAALGTGVTLSTAAAYVPDPLVFNFDDSKTTLPEK